MSRKLFFATVAFVISVNFTDHAFAGANDYVFEPVIVQTRIDMSPDAMGEMASPLVAVPSNEPGVYSFKTDLSMAGRWLLSIAAKVQGEAETVVGKITFSATR